MYPFYPYYPIPQQFPPWYNAPPAPQAFIPPNVPVYPQSSSLTNYSLLESHRAITNRDPKTLTDSEVSSLLQDHANELKRLHDKKQLEQIPILIDVVTILNHIQRATLVSVAENEFFPLLRTPFTDVLYRWCHLPVLSEDETFMFRAVAKLIKRLIKTMDETKLLSLWLSDSALLEAIADCLTDIATSPKLLDHTNKRQFKQFTRLFDAYIIYQQLLNTDTLVHLLHPVLQCLTSSSFVTTFTNIQTHNKSLTTVEKFFLLKCSAFLTSYNGSGLQETMDSLLTTMLPRYVIILDKLTLSVSNWTSSTMRAVRHLLEMMNHGASQFPTNAKLVGSHLAIIDHVLRLLGEPLFYANVSGSLSGGEMLFVNTAVSFLVNMINEPSVLAHIKQRRVAGVFLRLTSCEYEPLVLNVYVLLAYTTHEEDIKAMQNPGRLLSTIVKSLQTTLNQAPDNKRHKEQLLETLKGLVQHDQIKDEMVKQNILPFLLYCSGRLTDRAQLLILEILWSLTFREESAFALRSNRSFLNMIETISKNSKDEALKKAADGLVWKLIREPAFLEKVAKQEVEEKNVAKEVVETIIEEIVSSDGQKQLIAKSSPPANAAGERIFKYDIMFSYCHADKELTYKIHKYLVAQGFKIWIDLDNMYGPAMNAMADAVENSEFVIMCMSDSYKQSTYCQAEAEYAFNCKRRLLPLVMRQGYRPDGWLGFMIGSRIYVDFGKHNFETACDKLMTEITLQRRRPLPSKPDPMKAHERPTVMTSTKRRTSSSSPESDPPKSRGGNALSSYMKRTVKINFIYSSPNQWTESDVLDFLYTQRLIPLMPLCETMNGRALLQLYRMCIPQSNKAFVLLSNELKAVYQTRLSIGVFTRFLSAMQERLTTPPPPMPPQAALNPHRRTANTLSLQYNPPPPRTSIIQNFSIQRPLQRSVIQNIRTQHPLGRSIPQNVPVQYLPQSKQSYDILITSDAPALDILRAVERYGTNLAQMTNVQGRHSIRY